MDDVAAVAARLTAAQREVLFGQCGVPSSNTEWSSDCVCGKGGRAADCLIHDGLAAKRQRFPGGVILTPLGLAVRAHLTAKATS